MAKLSIRNVDFQGKKALVRVDFNVPMKDGVITNTARIEAALPTLRHILDAGVHTMVLMSHMGRPKGEKVEKFSLKPVAEALSGLLSRPVTMAPDCVGAEVKAMVDAAPAGSIIMLENLRFHAAETGKKASAEEVAAFRAQLASLADVYVNDAFGTAHRAHSSMMGEGYETRACGFLLEKELKFFDIALSNPKRPYLAILGGAKIADKIQLISNMLDRVDEIIICGGMAYTFNKVLYGHQIGNSLFDKEGAKIVPELVAKAEKKGVKIILPVDFIAADDFSNDANTQLCTAEGGIPDGWEGLDCGPASRALFKAAADRAQTIVWNGPAGVFEIPAFANGTLELCDAVVAATARGAITVIGGGDSATAVKNAGKEDGISHISTGGGASIELLQGNVLPGLEVLSDA